MRPLPPVIDRIIEFIPKIATAAKLFIFIGVAGVFVYLLKIRYFPRDFSLGDGLLVGMVAVCFGVAYTLFVPLLVLTEIVVSLGVQLVVQLVRALSNEIRESKANGTTSNTSPKTLKLRWDRIRESTIKLAYRETSFEWLAVWIGLVLLIAIRACSCQDSEAYWNWVLFSVMLYFLCSGWFWCDNRIRKIKTMNSHDKDTGEEKLATQIQLKKLKKLQMIFLVFFLIIPFFIAGVWERLLNDSMRLAHVRIDNSIVYIKDSYSALFPSSLKLEGSKPLEGFTAFKGVDILFSGVGKATFISFVDGGGTQKLKIPNDYIFIVESDSISAANKDDTHAQKGNTHTAENNTPPAEKATESKE